MTKTNRQWRLARRPQGLSSSEDFKFTKDDNIPVAREGEIIVHNRAFLCAPTIRNWMDPPSNSLYPSIGIGEVVLGPASGVVESSAHPKFSPGDLVATISAWQDYAVVKPEESMTRVLPQGHTLIEGVGVFGLNSLTGYFGIKEIGAIKSGESVLVSGAAGSAGSIAAQVAKLSQCRVVGIAGGSEKCQWLTDQCGLDAVIDYRKDNVVERIAALFPEGIDVFFDNVGGEILQGAVDHMAPFGRIVLCGQIASYNENAIPEGPRNMMRLVYGGIRMQGFLVGHFEARFNDALRDLTDWQRAGQLSHREDIRGGFENLPTAFNALFDGSNSGTLIVTSQE
ncbi:MAG: NADP-dependent oxidoreductase [Halioglobus sp.]|nr:NADP-dependent oxidoreductase [Halioglobus sp.]|tara:strand:+ start:949 stop:1965 length:1017 start_codon:yes stop_codon:yes gene_type:complete